MTFTQWWKRRVKKLDLRIVSPEGREFYREIALSAWNAARETARSPR